MAALKAFFRRIRPGTRARAFIYIALTVLLIFGMYILRGGQPATYMRAIRRAERAAFMGPGEVIYRTGLPKDEVTYYTNIYVLREKDSMALALTARQKYSGLILRYTDTDAVFLPVDRRPGMSLGTVSPYVGNNISEPKYLFAFDEYPDAVRAELELSSDAEDILADASAADGDTHLVYTAEARREADGMFMFSFNAHSRDDALEREVEEYLFFNLSQSFLYGEDMEGRRGLDVTVRFYRADGGLITEEKALWEY